MANLNSRRIIIRLNRVAPKFLDLVLKPRTQFALPRERIKARLDIEQSRQAASKEQVGDPIEALVNLLADIPDEVLKKNFEYHDNGLVYVKRHQD